MPSQLKTQSRCSTAGPTTPAQPSGQNESRNTRAGPAGDSEVTDPSAPHTCSAMAPGFLEAMWQTRLELAIFGLERRALPILKVFNRMPSSNVRWHRDDGRFHPVRSNQLETHLGRACTSQVLGIPTQSSAAELPPLRQPISQTPECYVETSPPIDASANTRSAQRLKTCGSWLKWRGPLPAKFQRVRVLGSAVFAHRYKHGGRRITRFWARQHKRGVIRWTEVHPSLPL
ncbi:hypothetical protein BS17DRAFT_773578 [Gyrodon lividus]|nr:hypothetical protein BS17DRAFT_773578 [Gyrodon lividus]